MHSPASSEEDGAVSPVDASPEALLHRRKEVELVQAQLSVRADQAEQMATAEENSRAQTNDEMQLPSPLSFPPFQPVPTQQLVAPAVPESPIVVTGPASLGAFLTRICSRIVPPRLVGILLVVASAVMTSLMALVASSLVSRVPPMQLVLARCSVQLVFGLIACRLVGVWWAGPPDWNKRKWLITRGFVGVSSTAFYFIAMSSLTLADATTLFFTSPLFTSPLGWLLLGETVSRFEAVCTSSSVVGVVLIVRPAFLFGSDTQGSTGAEGASGVVHTSTEHTTGVISAMLGSVASALVYICIRRVGPGVHPLVIVTYTSLVGSVLSPFGALFRPFIWPDASTAGLMFLLGSLSFCAQLLFNAGAQREKAGTSAMIRNLDVVCAFFWQVSVQHVSPAVLSILGALVVSLSVVAMGIQKIRADRQRAASVADPLADDLSAAVLEPNEVQLNTGDGTEPTLAVRWHG